MKWLQCSRHSGAHPDSLFKERCIVLATENTAALSPAASPFWNCLRCGEHLTPSIILLPVRDGCRSIKALPHHHNSELLGNSSSPRRSGWRLPLTCIPAGFLFLPNPASCPPLSQVIPRALLNKFPVHWTQSHSLLPGENQPNKI